MDSVVGGAVFPWDTVEIRVSGDNAEQHLRRLYLN